MNTSNPKFSLDTLRDNPDFAALFCKKTVEVKKNKADLLEAANQYQQKYSAEIEAGTRKRQLMLAEGERKGLKEEEIFKDNQLFIPTAQTPILNYLFFLLREHGDQLSSIKVLREIQHSDADLEVLREEFEKKYGLAMHDGVQAVETLPNVVKLAYGAVTDDTMAVLKKLKTLSMSDNEKEAFVAFRKGRELAAKCNIDWDRVPFNR